MQIILLIKVQVFYHIKCNKDFYRLGIGFFRIVTKNAYLSKFNYFDYFRLYLRDLIYFFLYSYKNYQEQRK